MDDGDLLSEIIDEQIEPPREARILFFDLENFPAVIESWDAWDASALRVLRRPSLAAVAWAWGFEEPECRTLPDYEATYARSKFDDRRLARLLWELMDEADIVVAHNADRFDARKAVKAFMQYGLGAPSPYRTIDTLKIARRHAMFLKNDLNSLAQELGVEGKIPTGGYSLWTRCMDGDPEAWEDMRTYALQDIRTLRGVYRHLVPWQTTVNMGLYDPAGVARCRSCGSMDLEPVEDYRTKVASYPAYRCEECGAISRARKQANDRERPELT